MKTSIFLTSFFSMNASGSKPRTSPAILVANCDASNFVMVSTPLRPASSAFQFSLVPIPSDDTRPMPVTTTRRLLTMLLWAPSDPGLLFGFGVGVDVLDRFLHARNLFRVFVGNLDPEFLFERHDELDGVERVGAQVVHERSIRGHLFFIDAQLLHDDALYFVGYGHSVLPLRVCCVRL